MIDITLSPDEVLLDAKKFGFEEYAKAFIYLISQKNNKTPITIAIHGEWGSGKSSLMSTIANILGNKSIYNSYFKKKKEKFPMKKTKIIWFNAWEFEKEMAISIALLSHVIKELKKDMTKTKATTKIKKVGKNISKIIVDLALKRVGGVTLNELIKHYKDYEEEDINISNFSISFKEAISEFIENNDKDYEQIVLFIDDLDRCSIEKSKDIIDTIHLILSTEHCIFLLGVDIEKLQKCLTLSYKDRLEFDAYEYIDKIVQLRFELPPISAKEMKKYINEIKPEGFKKEYIDIIIKGLTLKPRTIKLFMNMIKFQLTLSDYRGFKINESLLIEWLVLKKTFPTFTREIENNPGILEKYHSKKLIDKYIKLNDESKLDFLRRHPSLHRAFLDDSELLKVLMANPYKFTVKEVENVIYQTKSALPTEKEIDEPKFMSREKLQQLIQIGKNLVGLDLSNMNLEGFVFKGINLERVNLESANLKGVDFRKADLKRANLKGAYMYNADLSEATLDSAILEGAYLKIANLAGAKLWGAILEDADLTRSNLTDVFLESANLERADLSLANLVNANLKSAKLVNVNFAASDMSGANLSDANLRGAFMGGTELEGAIFKNITYDKRFLMNLQNSNWRAAIWDDTLLEKLNKIFSKSDY